MRIAAVVAVAATALVACRPLTNAVPRVAVAGEAGGGSHPMHIGETYFRDDTPPVMRLVATAHLGRLGRVFPVVRVERNPYSIDYTLDCRMAPDGSCMEHFPREYAFGAALGVAYPVTNRFAVTGVVGRSYSLEAGPTRQFVDAQLSYAAARNVAFTAGMRHAWWDEPEYGRLWYRPRTLGLRLQWP